MGNKDFSVELESSAMCAALRYFLRAMDVRHYTSDCSVPGRWIKHFSIECSEVERVDIDNFLTALENIAEEAEMALLRSMNEEE